MQNIILIAPPAAGKGTQSKIISEKYHLPHISTGDLLREAIREQNEIGKEIKRTMESGLLVSDDIVLKLLEERIKSEDCRNGYILDGFPRNVFQAQQYLNLLEKLNISLGYVIYLQVPKQLAKKRIIGRLSCPKCGAIYNDQFEETKPIKKGICNKCGSDLIKRSDDTEEVFEERYKIYENETYPLIQFFDNLQVLSIVDSSIDKETTFSSIEKIIDRGDI